jgi:phosphoribosylglycinamide formyltransferase-1
MAVIRRIGFLASGAGSTFEAVVAACQAGTLPLEPVIVIGNNGKAGVFERAQRLGVQAQHISAKTAGDATAAGATAADAAIAAALIAVKVDLLVLAGYLKMLGPAVLAAFDGRIINTHPALLPKFGGQGMYGMNVHKAVLAAGETTTGVTVHGVDEEYDHGPVLAQTTVPVEPGDTVETLAARVQVHEKLFLIETLGQLARGELDLPKNA